MKYSDGRPYYSLNSYYKQLFGKKMARLPIDGGFSCPNRDGLISRGGCTFCSQNGSGDFTARQFSIPQQIRIHKERYHNKWPDAGYIAYFQAFTNTYAPAQKCRELYETAISQPDISGISIATRPDCLPEDILEVLSHIHKQMPLWVELGLQTANETTANAIHRGYKNIVFEQAVTHLTARDIPVVVHIILGLPGETKQTVYDTIQYINRLPIHGIKLQLLHVLAGTELGKDYSKGLYTPLTIEEYINILCGCIARLRQDIVIYRITGDGPSESLLAPLWSLKKGFVLNEIHKELKRQDIFQGKFQ